MMRLKMKIELADLNMMCLKMKLNLPITESLHHTRYFHPPKVYTASGSVESCSDQNLQCLL